MNNNTTSQAMAQGEPREFNPQKLNSFIDDVVTPEAIITALDMAIMSYTKLVCTGYYGHAEYLYHDLDCLNGLKNAVIEGITGVKMRE